MKKPRRIGRYDMEREVSSEREQATTNRAGFPVRLGRGRIEEIPLTKYLFVI